MSRTTGGPLPTTRTYSGWGLAPGLLAKATGDWLKRKGYEVRATTSGDTHTVQARTAEAGWKGWFAKCPSLDAQVPGGPDRFSVWFGDGTWGTEPSKLTLGHKVGGFLTTVWLGDAAHRRQDIEREFWRLIEAACRACGSLGQTGNLPSTVTGTSQTLGEVRQDGTLPGMEEFKENFRCSACSHQWAGPKQIRNANLCAGCGRPCQPEMTGETVLATRLVGEVAPGDYVGDITFKNNYRCAGSSHAWQGPEYSGPRKLDRRLSYSGEPGKGNRWRASGRATRRRSRLRSPWRRSGATGR